MGAFVLTDINSKESENTKSTENIIVQELSQKKKAKEKQKKQNKTDEDFYVKNNHEGLSDLENNCNKFMPMDSNHENENNQQVSVKQKKHSKSLTKPKKTTKLDQKMTTGKKNKNTNSERRNRTDSKGSKDKERRSSSGKRDSGDEELKTTKSWNKVEEGVGVAIGRRKEQLLISYIIGRVPVMKRKCSKLFLQLKRKKMIVKNNTVGSLVILIKE